MKPSGFLVSNWLFLPGTNILFNLISKNASTSITSAFYDVYSMKRLDLVHHRRKNNISFETIATSSEYRKYTVIRNPIDRFLSAFYDKVIKNPITHDKTFSLFNKKFVNEKDTFRKLDFFLDYIEDRYTYGKNLALANHHIRPQYLMMYTSKINYDFILKFDNLYNDWNKFKNSTKINLPNLPYNHVTDSKKYLDQISPHQIVRIENLYSEDIKYYNEIINYP